MALLILLTVSVPLTLLLKLQIKLVTIQMIWDGFYGDSIIFETFQFFSLRAYLCIIESLSKKEIGKKAE